MFDNLQIPLTTGFPTPNCFGVSETLRQLVKRVRESKGWSQRKLAKEIGVETHSVWNLETGRTIIPREIDKWAVALGLPVSELIEAANASSNGKANGTPPADFDSNIDTYSETEVADVPLIEGLSVAAAEWSYTPSDDATGSEQHFTKAQIAAGKFRVRLNGKCMEHKDTEGDTKYRDGSIVEFQMVWDDNRAPGLDKLIIGKSYYIQLTDGRATFKQLVRIDKLDEDSKLILKCMNPKEKKTLTALGSDVVRIAIAAYWGMKPA